MSEKDENSGAQAESCVPGQLKKTIVMVGMMGAGKTAVGRALAARLDVPFLDSDHEIEAAANMSVPEIFSRDGEAFFREKEYQVIRRLLKESPGILSVGGGAFLAERNREIIGAYGVSICLQADLDVLWKRVKTRDSRPLLRTENPYQTLADLYEARGPIYALADMTVISDGQNSIENMVDRVLEALVARPDVLESL